MEESSSVHKYDKIFRENIEPIFLALAERSLGLSIASKKVLVDKIVSTAVREVDSLYEITTTDSKKIILHVEIQTDNDAQMVYRVGEYHGLVSKKYKLPIKHIVIYLGEKKTTMRSKLNDEEIYTHFELLSLRDMNTEELLNSNIPEEVLLAILSKFDKSQSEEIIQTTIIRLNELCRSKNRLKKFTSQLLILSKLRNLERQAINKIKDMTQLFDVTTSILFQQGEEIGQEIGQKIGHAGGLVQGMERGELKNQLIIIANMLTKSDLSTVQIVDLVEVKEALILDVKEKLDTKVWLHPDTWTEVEWKTYFEKKEE